MFQSSLLSWDCLLGSQLCLESSFYETILYQGERIRFREVRPFSVSFSFPKKYTNARFRSFPYAERRGLPWLDKCWHTHGCSGGMLWCKGKTDKAFSWDGEVRNSVLGIWLSVDFCRLNMTPRDSLRRTVTPYHQVLWICWEKVITLWLPQSFLVSACERSICHFAGKDFHFLPPSSLVIFSFQLLRTNTNHHFWWWWWWWLPLYISYDSLRFAMIQLLLDPCDTILFLIS